jgi:hypothetical protein
VIPTDRELLSATDLSIDVRGRKAYHYSQTVRDGYRGGEMGVQTDELTGKASYEKPHLAADEETDEAIDEEGAS